MASISNVIGFEIFDWDSLGEISVWENGLALGLDRGVVFTLSALALELADLPASLLGKEYCGSVGSLDLLSGSVFLLSIEGFNFSGALRVTKVSI